MKTMGIISVIKRIRMYTEQNPYKKAKLWEGYGLKIGERCQIFHGVSFGSEPYLVSLGDNVKVTAGTQFITHDGGVEVIRNLYNKRNIDFFGQIKVGNNVFIGNKCIILPGVSIGDNVVIGAGSVVTKNVPSNSVVAGVPAKYIKSIEEYYKKVSLGADETKYMGAKEKELYLKRKYNIIN
jgi:acetyltransferase-like isoleucine patch superfamily enzyme